MVLLFSPHSHRGLLRRVEELGSAKKAPQDQDVN